MHPPLKKIHRRAPPRTPALASPARRGGARLGSAQGRCRGQRPGAASGPARAVARGAPAEYTDGARARVGGAAREVRKVSSGKPAGPRTQLPSLCPPRPCLQAREGKADLRAHGPRCYSIQARLHERGWGTREVRGELRSCRAFTQVSALEKGLEHSGIQGNACGT